MDSAVPETSRSALEPTQTLAIELFPGAKAVGAKFNFCSPYTNSCCGQGKFLLHLFYILLSFLKV